MATLRAHEVVSVPAATTMRASDLSLSTVLSDSGSEGFCKISWKIVGWMASLVVGFDRDLMRLMILSTCYSNDVSKRNTVAVRFSYRLVTQDELQTRR